MVREAEYLSHNASSAPKFYQPVSRGALCIKLNCALVYRMQRVLSEHVTLG